jgi:hypothetical protein
LSPGTKHFETLKTSEATQKAQEVVRPSAVPLDFCVAGFRFFFPPFPLDALLKELQIGTRVETAKTFGNSFFRNLKEARTALCQSLLFGNLLWHIVPRQLGSPVCSVLISTRRSTRSSRTRAAACSKSSRDRVSMFEHLSVP